MKSFFISFLTTPAVALLTHCLRLNQFDFGTLELNFTWDDLTEDLWCKRSGW